ncbi:MAG: hypothetical protein Q8930_17910 [Bacillota bacterium]|nr:hypothetical protein [Bacillota bacterium]
MALFFREILGQQEEKSMDIRLKLYRLSVKYPSSLSPEMERVLHELAGRSLNDLPFIGSYLKRCTAILLDVLYSDGIISYLFDFSIEKIEYNSSVPVRRVEHSHIECRHYLRSSIVVITGTEEIEDSAILGVTALLPYYLTLKTTLNGLPDYSPPSWQEITLSMEELCCLGNILGDMLWKDITEPQNFRSLQNKLMQLDADYDKTVTAKPFRSNAFAVRIKQDESVRQLLINTKGEIKLNFLIPSYIIDSIISVVSLVKQDEINLQLLIPVEVILNSYFEMIHRDMLPEARLKLEKKILEDFIQLSMPGTQDEAQIRGISYIFFTAGFNLLVRIAASSRALEKSPDNFSFTYEALSTFLKLYIKHRYNITVMESRMDDVLYRFSRLIYEYQDSIAGLLNSKDSSIL